jgi:hypothetical protein
MSIAANDTDQQSVEHDDGESTPNDLAVIREQTFESLQILRNLLSLMMPKEGDDGPKLADLIAALVAQQGAILVGIKRLQTDMNALYDRLDGKNGSSSPHNPAG